MSFFSERSQSLMSQKSVHLQVSDESMDNTIHASQNLSDSKNSNSEDFSPLQVQKLNELFKRGYKISKASDNAIKLSNAYQMKYWVNVNINTKHTELRPQEESQKRQNEVQVRPPPPPSKEESYAEAFKKHLLQKKKNTESTQSYCPIRQLVEQDDELERIKVEQSKFKERKVERREQFSQDVLMYEHRKTFDALSYEALNLAYSQDQEVRNIRKYLSLHDNYSKKQIKNPLIQIIRSKGV